MLVYRFAYPYEDFPHSTWKTIDSSISNVSPDLQKTLLEKAGRFIIGGPTIIVEINPTGIVKKNKHTESEHTDIKDDSQTISLGKVERHLEPHNESNNYKPVWGKEGYFEIIRFPVPKHYTEQTLNHETPTSSV